MGQGERETAKASRTLYLPKGTQRRYSRLARQRTEDDSVGKEHLNHSSSLSLTPRVWLLTHRIHLRPGRCIVKIHSEYLEPINVKNQPNMLSSYNTMEEKYFFQTNPRTVFLHTEIKNRV